MVADLAFVAPLIWMRIDRSSTVGVGRGCQLVPVRHVLLVPGPVVAQPPEGLMPWSLPASGTTGRVACDLEVAAASCARRPAVAWPPVDDHRAWLPRVAEAALLREARKRRAAWLLHEPHSNIRSSYLEDQR